MPEPCFISTFLLRRGTALLGSMANPISARFCRTDLVWSQACRMWELTAKKERRRFCHLAVDPASRGPCLRTGPSPLDPWRCLPTSIPVQTLSVDIVTELLPPGLSLGLGHRAVGRTRSSNSEAAAQTLEHTLGAAC